MQDTEIIPQQIIESKILILRGKKVMLDRDLAALYSVETKMFKRTVKRNIERFPDDFMFQLTKEEFDNLKRHFGTSSWGGQRYRPYEVSNTIVLPARCDKGSIKTRIETEKMLRERRRKELFYPFGFMAEDTEPIQVLFIFGKVKSLFCPDFSHDGLCLFLRFL